MPCARARHVLLQADWEIPSSRESVDAASEWNQWLRDEVPAVFLAAVEAFVARATAGTAARAEAAAAAADRARAGGAVSPTTGAEAGVAAEVAVGASVGDGQVLVDDEAVALLSLLFQCVPLRGQCTEFFLPLAQPCCALLQAARCIPTRGGSLGRPHQVVVWEAVAHDPATRLMEPLLVAAGLRVLHPRARLPDGLAEQLGVRRVDAALLTWLLGELCAAPDRHGIDFGW